ncbi:MAG: hypothetical protein H0U21_05520 [Acidimicrobiia bacterium]|nr:hypothetical protein [Acidimicrobiia bacterium]
MAIGRRALVGAVARRLPWGPIGATAAACAAFTWVRAVQVDAAELVTPLRLSAVLLAGAAAGCLEDPAEVLTATTPFGRLRRRALAVAMTAAIVTVVWFAVVGVASVLTSDPARGPGIPAGGLTIELIATCAAGWLLAAWISASIGWRGSGMRAAIGVVIATLLSLAQPDVMGWLWAMPGSGAAWTDAHEHWALVGLVACVGAAALSRDPARRSVGWLRRA